MPKTYRELERAIEEIIPTAQFEFLDGEGELVIYTNLVTDVDDDGSEILKEREETDER